MLAKIKTFNWPLYSKFLVICAQLIIIFSIVILAFNTKEIDSYLLIVFYTILSAAIYLLFNYHHAHIDESKS